MIDLPPRAGATGGTNRSDLAGAAHRDRIRPKVVLQAHATRSLTALALLLHGHDRGARDLRNPLSMVIGSLVTAVIIVIVAAVGGRVGALVHHT